MMAQVIAGIELRNAEIEGLREQVKSRDGTIEKLLAILAGKGQ